MTQFTDSQLATVKAAVEFLAETQRANHAHIAANVQEVLDLFKPVVAEVVVEAAPVVEEVPVVEEAPAKGKKAKAVEETPVAEETPAE